MSSYQEHPKGLALLPFYVLVDVSYSMLTPEEYDGQTRTGMDAVNEIAPQVFNLFRKAPQLRDQARFGIVDFAGGATTPLALCDPAKESAEAIPTLIPRQDGTSYAAAFRAMRERIEDDVAHLKADDHRVYRPAVFFLTDGEPNPGDRIDAAWNGLVAADFNARPNVIPFGIREAQKSVLDRFARYKTPADESGNSPPSVAFMARDGVPATRAIEKMIDILLQSILASDPAAMAASAGNIVLPPPQDLNDEEDIYI